MPAKFALGRVVVTPGCLEVLMKVGVGPLSLLARHVAGDWGDLDLHDRLQNDMAITNGARIMSAYVVRGVKIWIITEATDDEGERESTCLLLPEEY
jgi:hypothetical protein